MQAVQARRGLQAAAKPSGAGMALVRRHERGRHTTAWRAGFAPAPCACRRSGQTTPCGPHCQQRQLLPHASLSPSWGRPPCRQVVEEKPVLVCDVEYLPDAEDAEADSPEVGCQGGRGCGTVQGGRCAAAAAHGTGDGADRLGCQPRHYHAPQAWMASAAQRCTRAAPCPRPRPPQRTARCGGGPVQARALAREVSDLFRNVVSLSVKLKEATVPDEIANPRQLAELAPRELSFWVASLFAGNPYQVRAAAAGACAVRGWPGCNRAAPPAHWDGRSNGCSGRALHADARRAPAPPLPCSNRRCLRRRRRWGGSRPSTSC